MTAIFKKPLFWTIFTCISIVLTYFAYHFFPQAFPLVHINITMNRTSALKQAQQIATKYNCGPEQAQQTATFITDNVVKTFVELEGGGKQAFVDMMQQDLYQPYTWCVRLFKEFETNETYVRFTPDGKPYGFIEILSENTPGSHLDTQNAQHIAETTALKEWHVDLTPFKRVESSKEIRPSGRADHTFVYERTDAYIGQGYYRLRLKVSGDKLTELTYFVKVPDDFVRRYQEMRSANETISYAAQIIMILLYILGGCVIGLFFLYKKHWLIWNKPLLWALIIAFLGLLDTINQLPLMWMKYNTALASYVFLLHFILNSTISFLYNFTFLFTVFMTGESLTRAAFGNQIQLWRTWSTNIASSWSILGRTISGYLMVPIHFAFGVAFYIFTTKYFGWWIPSESLFDPNILATYIPWLRSIAVSLYAGFMEECLFRAIPLASAMLLGQKFGRKNLWIISAFILQAIIFGAAHANYPAQPAYARLIELLMFSCVTGGIYLRFGLLPAIITHFVYDVIWFALPLFVSSAPGAITNQTFIIILSLIPLWVVIHARLKTGLWNTLQIDVYNKAWQPSETTYKKEIQNVTPHIVTITQKVKIGCIVGGIIGLCIWLFTTQFKNTGLPLTINRYNAIQLAKHSLEEKNNTSSVWYPLSNLMSTYEQNPEINFQHRFIWQEGGQKIYNSFLGSYLDAPQWIIRFVQFEGNITDRAEEYAIHIQQNGQIFRTKHLLPETWPGAHLSKQDARNLAHKILKQNFNLNSTDIKEISAISTKEPNRLDWTFTFAHKNIYPLTTGEARIDIKIAGNILADSYRYIHVPEEWERDEQNKQNIAAIVTQLCCLLLYMLFIIGLSYAFIQLSAGNLNLYNLATFTVFFLGLLLFQLLNNWPQIIASFNTSQPFYDQVFRIFGSISIWIIIKALAFGLMFVFLISWKNAYCIKKTNKTIALGISLGIVVAAIQSFIQKIIPSLEPHWPDYTPFVTIWPFGAGITNNILFYISITMIVSIACIIINHGTKYWQKYTIIFSFFMIFLGMILAGLQYADNLPLLLILGITFGIFFVLAYTLIIRFDNALIPLTTGSYTILKIVQQGIFNAFPGALAIALASSIAIIYIAWHWFQQTNA